MKYNYDYTVKYQDVDDTRLMRLYTLERYLLEVAGTCADELGFGTQALLPRNETWILTNMSIEMQRLPHATEKIRIETWIEGNAHMLSVRDFRIYLQEEGEWSLIGCCKSTWAVLELTKREIVNIFDDPMFEGAVDGEVLEMARAPRLRALSELTEEKPGTVHYSDLDYNGHCNSCQYTMKMMDAHRPDLSRPVRMDIAYSREVKEGDALRIGYLSGENGTQYQILDPQGQLSCACMVKNI